MKRAALYARVSTDRQREEATLESQVAEIRAAIREAGHQLTPEQVYSDDGYTGELLARPALDRMRDDARKGLFEVLYVYDRGRLSRKFAYQELILDELSDLGVQFVTLHDTRAETPEERVLQAMQGVFHEYERLKITERLRRGKLYKVRSGRPLGGIAPYGYDYFPREKGQDGYLAINSVEAEVVRLLFRWVGEEGASIREVVRRLRDRNIPPRNGGRATWGKSSVARILRSETYTGTLYYNKTEAVLAPPSPGAPRYRRVKKTGRRTRPREEWIAIPVPPIIERELFQKTQRQLAANVRFSPRNTRRDYLLQGVIYCPCGQRRTVDGKNGLYYYRCADRHYRFPLPRTCYRGGIAVRRLDPLVWEMLCRLLTDPALLREQAECWLEKGEARAANEEEEAARLTAALQQLRAEEERYTRAYGAELMSFETYENLMQQLNGRREHLEREARQSQEPAAPGAHRPPITTDETVRLAVRALARLEQSERKFVVRKLVDRVVADREEVTITGWIPLTGEEETAELRPGHPDVRNSNRLPATALRPRSIEALDAKLPFEIRLPLIAEHPTG